MKNFYISKSLNLFQLSCLIIFLLQNPQPIQAQDIIHSCPSTSSNFTSGSKFETNLKTLLLPSLISNGPINGFFNTSFGNNPDTVYGLVQCTDDLSIEECKNCLNISSSLIFQRCLNHQDAGIRLKSCVLHYSNVNFFSQYNGSTPDYEWDGPNVSDDEDKYNSQLGFLMNNLVSDAISKPSKFQTGSIRYNNFSSVYGMVQCSRDLSSKDCSSCLQTMVNEIQVCCSGKRGGIVLSLNCFVRFSNSVFFQSSSSSSPPLPTIGGSSKPSPPGVTGKGKRSSLNVVVIVVPTIIGGALLLLAIWLCLFKRKRWGRATKSGVLNGDGLASAESLQFDLATIRMATNDFSYANKLGEGGFGTVYKGELPDGQEIAVKRLSIGSGQGSQEFTNEVVLIHKLQHRNLVRLLGFCLENEEQILIYEYVANRSLDKYLFDSSRKSILNWEERNKIIGGIARGLLYLHEDSRLRIIHRDLKAGNILLDENMSPKIADFGMAKLFQLDQTRGNTSRIAGTLGYMAPEYALHGLFSVKSDVFSFGVLILEIISGRKVTSFVHSASSEDLLSFAWIHWRKGTSIDVMDPTLADKLSTNEVIRSIQIGLLCVQEKVEDRPTMSSIVLMLSSSAIILPSPSKPSFFAGSSNTSHTVTNEWESDRSRSTASA